MAPKRILLSLATLVILFTGCESVGVGEDYASKKTGDQVRVHFVGSENDMVAKFGPLFKYQPVPGVSSYIVFGPKVKNPPVTELTTLPEDIFLAQYSWVDNESSGRDTSR